MAIGSSDDIYLILKNELAPWYGSTLPKNIDALLQNYVSSGVFNYTQYEYIDLQTRIQTATGENLDLISRDYFNNEFQRRHGQGDGSYRSMLEAFLILERGTRNGLSRALTALTGNVPVLFEFWNPADAGAYNISTTAYDISKYGGGLDDWAYQGFADVYVSAGSGMAFFGGFGEYIFPYDEIDQNAFNFYGSDVLLQDVITDDDIYAVINAFKLYGTVVWTRIHRGEVPPTSQQARGIL